MQHKDELWWSAVRNGLRAASLACRCFGASQCLFLSSLSRTLFTWQSPLHCFYLSAHSFSLSDDVLNRAGCIVLLFHAHLMHCGEVVCGLVLVVFHFSERGLLFPQRQAGTSRPRKQRSILTQSQA